MTTRELTNIALKVFAIYILLQAVSMTPMLYQAVTMLGENIQNQSAWLMGVGIATLIALVAISVLIWKMANSFLEKATSVGSDSEQTTPVGESFLLSLLGIYLTFEGLQRFGFVCVAQYTKVKVGVSEEELTSETVLYLFGYFVQFIYFRATMTSADF